jgi:hypothetical protein
MPRLIRKKAIDKELVSRVATNLVKTRGSRKIKSNLLFYKYPFEKCKTCFKFHDIFYSIFSDKHFCPYYTNRTNESLKVVKHIFETEKNRRKQKKTSCIFNYTIKSRPVSSKKFYKVAKNQHLRQVTFAQYIYEEF